MSIFDKIKNKGEGTSDIMRSAIESGIEKALAEIEQNISEAEELLDEHDRENVDSDKPTEEKQEPVISDDIKKLMGEIKTMREDIQSAVLRAKGTEHEDTQDPDKALASVLGLYTNNVSPTLDREE